MSWKSNLSRTSESHLNNSISHNEIELFDKKKENYKLLKVESSLESIPPLKVSRESSLDEESSKVSENSSSNRRDSKDSASSWDNCSDSNGQVEMSERKYHSLSSLDYKKERKTTNRHSSNDSKISL